VIVAHLTINIILYQKCYLEDGRIAGRTILVQML